MSVVSLSSFLFRLVLAFLLFPFIFFLLSFDMASIAQSVQLLATGSMTEESFDLWLGQRIFSLLKSVQFLGPTLSPFHFPYRGFFTGKEAWGLTLSTYLHLVPDLRMRGALPSLFRTFSWLVFN
jgi:hypothetical protein